MLKKVYNRVVQKFLLSRSIKVDKKYVIIESDDWGMQRMPDKRTFDALLKKGYPVDNCPYSSNDSLESNTDLEMLFETLSLVKDSLGKHPVFTVNNVVANPDYNRIRASGYSDYFYESFEDTLNRYPDRDQVLRLYRDGIISGLFNVQFHGREHLNVRTWMTKLQNKDKSTHDAFHSRMFSLPVKGLHTSNADANLDAFGSYNSADIESYRNIIDEGISLFKTIHHKTPRSFIAPCYTWPSEIEEFLNQYNIRTIQGNPKQVVPFPNAKSFKSKTHFTGETNYLGQVYAVRNVYFEPFSDPNRDWISESLRQIRNAFNYSTPAIISTHRVNYIGSLNEKNRKRGNQLLGELLHTIVKQWHDIVFISSDQLFNSYNG